MNEQTNKKRKLWKCPNCSNTRKRDWTLNRGQNKNKALKETTIRVCAYCGYQINDRAKRLYEFYKKFNAI